MGRCQKRFGLKPTERLRKQKLAKAHHKVQIKIETPKTFAGALLGFGSITMLLGYGFKSLTANPTLFNVGLGLIAVSVLVWGLDLAIRKGKL